MRKAVKLAAMSTLAAVAMVGGSATVASADGDKIADNICGNTASAPVVGHDNVSTTEGDNLVCQTGQGNVAYNYVEGNEVGEDLISQVVALVDGDVEIES